MTFFQLYAIKKLLLKFSCFLIELRENEVVLLSEEKLKIEFFEETTEGSI